MKYVLNFFYPIASATVYGRRPKFFRAEHWAMAEGENWAYGPTLSEFMIPAFHDYILFGTKNHEMRGPLFCTYHYILSKGFCLHFIEI